MTDFSIEQNLYRFPPQASGMEHGKGNRITAAAKFHSKHKLQPPPPSYIVMSSIPALREPIIVITEKSVIN